MPQLMPLMWINSIVVSLFILFMLINLYNLNEEFNLEVAEEDKSYCEIKMMW